MAKLILSDAETTKVAELCQALFKSFDALADIDTEQVEPMYTVLNTQNTFREDVVVKSYSRDELLAYAPVKQDGYFQVPKTI